MLLVFDSYDMTGKTITAKVMAKLLNYQFPSFLSSQKVTLNQEEHKLWAKAQYFFLANLEKNTKMNMVLDRWFMTERCYAPIVRGYIPDYIEQLEEIVKDNIMWVYLTIPEDRRRNFLEERIKNKQEAYTLDQILDVSKEYDKYYKNSTLNKIVIHQSDINYTNEITKVCVMLYQLINTGRVELSCQTELATRIESILEEINNVSK